MSKRASGHFFVRYGGRPAIRLVLSGSVGVLGGLLSAVYLPWFEADLLGWDGAAIWFLVGIWSSISGLDAPRTEEVAHREEPNVAIADAILLSAGVISLVGAGIAFFHAADEHGGAKAALIGVGISSVMLSWSTVHTIYTLRYARQYYAGTHGGINFNEHSAPCYLDFAYVAFTIGMTFQVSDTNLTTKAVRHLALRHALLSYLFGVFIIAMTINLVASLIH